MKAAQRIAGTVAAVGMMLSLTVAAAASSPVSDVTVQRAYETAGAAVQTATAQAAAGSQTLYSVTAPAGQGFGFMLGGTVGGKMLVPDMAAGVAADSSVAQVIAGVNGDHFSFQTGVPLGISISEGRLVTDPVPPEEADEYYFYTMGITRDGQVLTGQSPTLYMQYTLNGETYTIDRLNRTRENWEGGRLCLYTPDYGASTGTGMAGSELIIRVDEGEVSPANPLKGTVIAVNEDNDSPLEQGTVVLSAYAMRMQDLTASVGDTVEFSFTFEEEGWNDVWFAVGGNSVIVEDSQPIYYDYTIDVFADPQPRTALGVKADGSLVLAAVDGRSDISQGLTANEMADYMAEDMGCRYALLLDGGGSTAMVAADESGTVGLLNVPSEERPVGNGVFLVKFQPDAAAQWGLGSTDSGLLWIVAVVAGVVVAAAVITGILVIRHKK